MSENFLDMNFDLQQEISDLDLDSSAAQDKVFLSEFQREIQYLNRESIYQAKEILKQVPHLSAKELDKLVNILLTGISC